VSDVRRRMVINRFQLLSSLELGSLIPAELLSDRPHKGPDV
jgi:hypothetical protein